MPHHPSIVASLSMDGEIYVTDVNTNNQPNRLQHPSHALAIEWCPQREGTLACGTEDGQLCLWSEVSQSVRSCPLTNSPINVAVSRYLNDRTSPGISLKTAFSEWPTKREWESMTLVRNRSHKSPNTPFLSLSESPSPHPALFFVSTH